MITTSPTRPALSGVSTSDDVTQAPLVNASDLPRSRVHSRYIFAVALIFFAAMALRLWNLGTQSLWHDEAWSVFSGYHPLAWGMLGTDINAPPIYYMTLGIWQRLVGDAVWTMRCWSALLGLFTVTVGAMITRRWYGERAALGAALFIAVSPILWVFSQEIRAYVMTPLLALLLMLLAEKLLTHPTRRIWAWILVTEAVTLYVHNLSVPTIAWLVVTVGMALLVMRQGRRFVLWGLSQVGMLLVYIPWLTTQKPTGTPLNTPPTLDLTLVWNIWQSYFTGIKTLVSADTLLMALTLLFGVISLVAILIALLRIRSLRTILLLSQVILIPIFEVGIILAAHIDFHPRYFIVGVPATLILIAVGLDRLTRVPMVPRLVLGFSAVLAIGIMVRMFGVMYSSPIYQHDDFRSIAERYAKLGPNDALIIPYGWEPTLDYYSRKMNFQAKFINISLHAAGETVIDTLQTELQGVQHAEVLTWYQLPADVRGAFPCILGGVAHKVDDLTVQGIKTDTYAAFDEKRIAQPHLDTSPALSNPIGTVGPLTLLGEDNIWGKDGLCVISDWGLNQPTTESAHLLVSLSNDLGWEIGRSDSVMLNNFQLPTNRWQQNQTERVFTWLPLPEGVPHHNYAINAMIYDSQTPQGYISTIAKPGLATTIPLGQAIAPEFSYDSIKPGVQDLKVDDFFYIHQKEIPTGKEVIQGQQLHVTLEWWQLQGTNNTNATISLEGDHWKQSTNNKMCSTLCKRLSWSQFTVPADATGNIQLKAQTPDGNSITLAEYTVKKFNRAFSLPSLTLNSSSSATFEGVGTLLGVQISTASIENSKPFPITLLWKASATPSNSYKVFVHLLDSGGQVVAQSDAEPTNNGETRQMPSWLAGEYLIDVHQLTFNRTDYHGQVTLEVGLYDPQTGQRVKLDNGSDHAVLPLSLTVQ